MARGVIGRSRQKEPELIALLYGEYLDHSGSGLVCLSRDESQDSFPRISRRPVRYTSEAPRLSDAKTRILEMLARDDRVLEERTCMSLAPLHLVCSLHSPGQAEVVRLLASQKSSNVNVLDALSRTPLHHALNPLNQSYLSNSKEDGGRLIETVTCLVSCLADVNALDCYGLSPLHYLLDYFNTGGPGHLPELPVLVRLLVKAGAVIDSPCRAPESPLHVACRLPGPYSLDALKVMVTENNVNTRNVRSLQTPLLSVFASKVSCSAAEDKVRLLLSKGAEVNVADVNGITPVLSAINFMKHDCHVSLLRFLVDNGATVSVQDDDTLQTPLHLVCSYFDAELRDIIPLFVKTGGELNVRDISLSTPFHCSLAKQHCSLATLRYLMDAGADPLLTDLAGNGSIHHLCRTLHPQFKDVVKLLVDRGCDINQANARGDTPLMFLLENNPDVERVRALLDLGADCRATNKELISPLHVLSRALTNHQSVDDIIHLVISSGGDVNYQDCCGNTPLHYSVRDRSTTNPTTVSQLVRAGANPNTKNSLGVAPLHVVCSSGDLTVAKILLDFGANVNLSDAESNTPLHIAAAADQGLTVGLLLERGADLAARNCSNATPLLLMRLTTCKPMIEWTALEVAIGKHHLNQREFDFFDSNLFYKKRFDHCLDQARSMNLYLLANSTVSLTGFLMTPHLRATRFVVNSDIVEDLLRLVANNTFAPYTDFIEQKLNKVTELKALLEAATRALLLLVSPSVFPEYLTEPILRLLNEEDLVAMAQVASSTLRVSQ